MPSNSLILGGAGRLYCCESSRVAPRIPHRRSRGKKWAKTAYTSLSDTTQRRVSQQCDHTWYGSLTKHGKTVCMHLLRDVPTPPLT